MSDAVIDECTNFITIDIPADFLDGSDIPTDLLAKSVIDNLKGELSQAQHKLSIESARTKSLAKFNANNVVDKAKLSAKVSSLQDSVSKTSQLEVQQSEQVVQMLTEIERLKGFEDANFTLAGELLDAEENKALASLVPELQEQVAKYRDRVVTAEALTKAGQKNSSELKSQLTKASASALELSGKLQKAIEENHTLQKANTHLFNASSSSDELTKNKLATAQAAFNDQLISYKQALAKSQKEANDIKGRNESLERELSKARESASEYKALFHDREQLLTKATKAIDGSVKVIDKQKEELRLQARTLRYFSLIISEHNSQEIFTLPGHGKLYILSFETAKGVGGPDGDCIDPNAPVCLWLNEEGVGSLITLHKELDSDGDNEIVMLKPAPKSAKPPEECHLEIANLLASISCKEAIATINSAHAKAQQIARHSDELANLDEIPRVAIDAATALKVALGKKLVRSSKSRTNRKKVKGRRK